MAVIEAGEALIDSIEADEDLAVTRKGIDQQPGCEGKKGDDESRETGGDAVERVEVADPGCRAGAGIAFVLHRDESRHRDEQQVPHDGRGADRLRLQRPEAVAVRRPAKSEVQANRHSEEPEQGGGAEGAKPRPGSKHQRCRDAKFSHRQQQTDEAGEHLRHAKFADSAPRAGSVSQLAQRGHDEDRGETQAQHEKQRIHRHSVTAGSNRRTKKVLQYTAVMALDLKIIGPFRGPTGYDHHVREFSRELARQGVKIELVDLPRWGPMRLPFEQRDPWFETLTTPSKGRVVLHFTLPEQVVAEPGKLNANLTMFEATRIPASWVEAHKHHDLVILPTEASQRAWTASGVPESKIRLCPLGVSAGFLRDRVPPVELRSTAGRRLNDYRVRFLNVSEIGIRKNFRGLVRTWLRATSPSDDAVLALKVGSYQPGAMFQLQNAVEAAQHDAGKALSEAAPVQFIREIYPDADLPRLFAFATHYISLSHGEGWDLSMMEAAATGLKLIAPDHSAYPTYLNADIASFVPSVEVPCNPPGGAAGTYFEGANWWQPDEDAAASLIRDAIDGRDGGKASPRPHIAENFGWPAATRRLIEILTELESTHA